MNTSTRAIASCVVGATTLLAASCGAAKPRDVVGIPSDGVVEAPSKGGAEDHAPALTVEDAGPREASGPRFTVAGSIDLSMLQRMGSMNPAVLAPTDKGPLVVLKNFVGNDDVSETLPEGLQLTLVDPVAGKVVRSKVIEFNPSQIHPYTTKFVGVHDISGDGRMDLVARFERAELAKASIPAVRLFAWDTQDFNQLWAFDGPEVEGFWVAVSPPPRGDHRGQESLFMRTMNYEGLNWRSRVTEHAMEPSGLVARGSIVIPPPYSGLMAVARRGALGAPAAFLAYSSEDSSDQMASISTVDAAVNWTRKFPASNFGTRRTWFAVADVDLRGTTDMVVAVGEYSGPCRMVCVAGEDGADIWATDAVESLDCRVHAIGDVTGDGAPDVIVVSSTASPAADNPPVLALDGTSGVIVGSWFPATSKVAFHDTSLAAVDASGNSWFLAGNLSSTLWLVRVEAP